MKTVGERIQKMFRSISWLERLDENAAKTEDHISLKMQSVIVVLDLRKLETEAYTP